MIFIGREIATQDYSAKAEGEMLRIYRSLNERGMRLSKRIGWDMADWIIFSDCSAVIPKRFGEELRNWNRKRIWHANVSEKGGWKFLTESNHQRVENFLIVRRITRLVVPCGQTSNGPTFLAMRNAHYPPYGSEDDAIEHRVFPHVTCIHNHRHR